MSKIARKTAQLFGVNAGATGVEEFASKEIGGTLVYSTDPAVIQTAAWTLGWSAAQYEGVFAPYFQDRNAVDLVIFYQLAYILQQGIAEWDSGTTYYTNSIVQNGGDLYISLVDGNVGNTPPAGASNSYWGILLFRNSITPTRTVLTSGSGTYTPPSGCRRLFVRMVGGGGGGNSSGQSGDGVQTTFGSSFLVCAGGVGSASPFIPAGSYGGDINIAGAMGQRGCLYTSSDYEVAGAGGSSPFGGAGAQSSNSPSPSNASPNSGSGGGSGYGISTGGAAGAYLEKTIYSPATSYPYSVGAGGTGGTGSPAGGNGGSGVIIIDEYYF